MESLAKNMKQEIFNGNDIFKEVAKNIMFDLNLDIIRIGYLI
jgi:hypothetical protein